MVDVVWYDARPRSERTNSGVILLLGVFAPAVTLMLALHRFGLSV
jgi:hypothetical protein